MRAPPREASKRACDLCHRRKLKCNGLAPCDRCSRTRHLCTFNNPVLPKGPAPKGTSKRAEGKQRAVSPPSDDPQALMTQWPTFETPIDGSLLDINNLVSFSPFEQGTSMMDTASQLLQWQMPAIPPQPIALPEEACPMLVLTLESLIKPQLVVFFDRVYSMIPVYTRDDVFARLAVPESRQDKSFIAMVLAMAALSLVHPLQPDEVASKVTRAQQATMLLDESCRLAARWDFGCASTIEGCLTSYLVFGTLFELGYAEGAKIRLQEAIAQGEAMRLHMSDSYAQLTAREAKRRMRMFWILAVTERAYALQRSGQLVFRGAIATEIPHLALTYPGSSPTTPSDTSHSLKHLAAVFSVIDQQVVSCWNGDGLLPPFKAASILRQLHCPDISELNEVQRADLLITWQWIKSRIWRLAQGQEDVVGYVELAPAYVVEIGQQTVEICKLLSFSSMEAHGTGFVEKLYDIASLVSANLRNLQRPQAYPALETLQMLFFYVSRHRKGTKDYAGELGEVVQGSVRLLSA